MTTTDYKRNVPLGGLYFDFRYDHNSILVGMRDYPSAALYTYWEWVYEPVFPFSKQKRFKNKLVKTINKIIKKYGEKGENESPPSLRVLESTDL